MWHLHPQKKLTMKLTLAIGLLVIKDISLDCSAFGILQFLQE